MSTNYYVRENVCDCCGRYDELHLGKSSMGWQFTFQYNGGEYYKNVAEMRKWLEGKRIFDEYDKEISNDEFWQLVESKQKPEFKNHTIYCREHHGIREFEMLIDGYSFINVWFS